MQGAFAALLVIVLQTLVPHGQPMREINCCVMMLVMMLLLFLLLFFAFAVAVAGGFFCLSSFLWGRRVWIRKTLSIDFFFVCWMLPLLWRKCSTRCCHQTFGAPWLQIQNSELACRIPVASGAKAVLPRYPNLCYCFGYLLSYTTHSDCKPRPSSAEACDIRAMFFWVMWPID